MALLDRLGPITHKKSVKSEEMSIDLSLDNPPTLNSVTLTRADKGKGRQFPLGNHHIEMPDLLTEARLTQHNASYIDDYDMVTDHDWHHPNPMGDRPCSTTSVL